MEILKTKQIANGILYYYPKIDDWSYQPGIPWYLANNDKNQTTFCVYENITEEQKK